MVCMTRDIKFEQGVQSEEAAQRYCETVRANREKIEAIDELDIAALPPLVRDIVAEKRASLEQEAEVAQQRFGLERAIADLCFGIPLVRLPATEESVQIS